MHSFARIAFKILYIFIAPAFFVLIIYLSNFFIEEDLIVLASDRMLEKNFYDQNFYIQNGKLREPDFYAEGITIIINNHGKIISSGADSSEEDDQTLPLIKMALESQHPNGISQFKSASGKEYIGVFSKNNAISTLTKIEKSRVLRPARDIQRRSITLFLIFLGFYIPLSVIILFGKK